MNSMKWSLSPVLILRLLETHEYLRKLNLPPLKTDISKATDAGPGVGCSNTEISYKDTEMARILNLDRINRVHRARGNSGQNEAE